MDGPIAVDAKLARRLMVDHPVEAARLLEGFNSQEVLEALLDVEVDVAAGVLKRLERSHATACLASWPEENRAGLLSTLDLGFAARLLRSLDEASREGVLSCCPERVAGPIRRLLRYPQETAGALMDPRPPAAPGDISVEAARRLLERWSSRTRGQLYIVTREDVLVGLIEIDDLLHAPQEETLGSLMKPVTDRLPARADRAAIASHPGWLRHHTLPVVDRNDALIGTIDLPTLRELEEDWASKTEDPPLGLVVGEMYWSVLSTLVENILGTLRTKEVHR